MAANIGSVYMDLRAASTNLNKDIDKAMKRTQKQLIAVGKKMTFAIAASLTAATAAITASTKKGLEAVDDLAKTADKLGIATESLQAFRHAATIAGAATKELDLGLEKMARSISEASQGSGEAGDALRELGLSATALNTAGPEEQFKAIAEAMSGVSNSSDQIRLAMDIFGRGGGRLLETLKTGRVGLEAMRKEMDLYGVSISRIDAAKVEAANDAMARTQLILSGISNRFAVEFAPMIEAAAKKLLSMAEGGQLVGQSLSNVINFVGGIATAIDNVVYGARIAINAMVVSFSAVGFTAAFVAEEIRKSLTGAMAVARVVFDNIETFAEMGFDGAKIWAIDFALKAISKFQDVQKEARKLFKLMGAFNGLTLKILDGVFPDVAKEISGRLQDNKSEIQRNITANWQDYTDAEVKAEKAWLDATSTQTEGTISEWRDTMGAMFTDAYDKVGQMIEDGVPGLRILDSFKQLQTDADNAAQKISESIKAKQGTVEPVIIPAQFSFETSIESISDAPAQALEAFRNQFDLLKTQLGENVIGLDEFQKGVEEMKARVQEAQAVFSGTRTSAENYKTEIERLSIMLNDGLITQETYNRAIEDTARKYDLTQQPLKSVVNATSKYSEAINKLRNQLKGGIIDQEKFDNATAEAGQKYQKTIDDINKRTASIQDRWDTVNRGISSSIDQMVETGKFSFKGMVDSIMKDMLKLQLKKMILGTGLGSGGSGGIIRGIAGMFRGFASGGRPQPGVPSIVGEKGQELFIPDQAGTIIPHMQTQAILQRIDSFKNGVPQIEIPEFAQGGRPDVGQLSSVGEQGRELFMPDSFMKSPASAVASNISTTSSNDVKNITTTNKSVIVNLEQNNTFEGGVSVEQVGEALSKHGQKLISQITDGIQRGGAFRQAFQG